MPFPSRSNRLMTFCLASIFCVAGLCAAETIAESGDLAPVSFNREVRPILSENCFACHGPDANQRKAKLRLDIREVALDRGVLAPGRPETSELIQRITSEDPDEVMPPPHTHKKLSDREMKTLTRWIAEGAEYERHWSFIVPQRPAVPEVAQTNWVRSPVDAFILRKLERLGLPPAPTADPRTLIRRLSLDLTGLPPSVQEVEDFVRDPSPAAYAAWVERLLSSPHFGERMAVPWLDVVRYADTVGYHGDQNINVFPYRDYVIRSFNENRPFDRFTIEQIAGDLMPNATAEQRAATGFNRLNMVTREGGAQPEEYLAKYGADRVRTVATAWMGATLGCAECHDHKYDPFTTRDFYQLKAFFADVKQWGVYADYSYTPNPDLRGWGNDHPFPPELQVESRYLQRRMARLQTEMDELISESGKTLTDDRSQMQMFGHWLANARDFLVTSPDGWSTPAPSLTVSGNDSNAGSLPLRGHPDGSVQLVGKLPDGLEVVVPLPAITLAAVRLEALPPVETEGVESERSAENFHVRLKAELRSKTGEGPQKLGFYHAEATAHEDRFSQGLPILGVNEGWALGSEDAQLAQRAVWLLDPPRVVKEGDALVVTLSPRPPRRFRLSVTPFAGQQPLRSGANESLRQAIEGANEPGNGGSAIAATSQSDAGAEGADPCGDRKLSEDLLQSYWLSTAPDVDAFARYKDLYRQYLECRGGLWPTVVTEAWQPPETRVLPRGDWQDKSGERVEPAVPGFLPQIGNADGRRLTRLDLARWLVSRDNPLTARTIMNRLWKELFGRGLSSVVDDLGAQGEWPTHPDLLDWLAVEFMESGWDYQHMVRTIVLSSTYRQSTEAEMETLARDPSNRWWARQSPRRLDAEFVRDNALAVAGLLNNEIGGPSVRPYQPPDYYANLQFPDRTYRAEEDDRQFRRGLYTHWQRTFLHPMLANFDAPSREECVAQRTLSNTPQQALTLLNDPTFVEASRGFAVRLLRANLSSDDDRLDRAFRLALARPAKEAEKRSLSRFLEHQRSYYNHHPSEAAALGEVGITPPPTEWGPAELAAWTQLCRVVLNLHETVTRY